MAFRGDETLDTAEAQSVDILSDTFLIFEDTFSVDKLIICGALRTSAFKNIVNASLDVNIAEVVPDMVPLVADATHGLVGSKGLAICSHRQAQSSDLHEARTALLASPEEIVLDAVCGIEHAAG